MGRDRAGGRRERIENERRIVRGRVCGRHRGLEEEIERAGEVPTKEEYTRT